MISVRYKPLHALNDEERDLRASFDDLDEYPAMTLNITPRLWGRIMFDLDPGMLRFSDRLLTGSLDQVIYYYNKSGKEFKFTRVYSSTG